LCQAVEDQVRYHTPDDDGVTRAERNAEFDMADLTPQIEPPEDGFHIWGWFWDLSACRSGGMNGPNPISYTELEAWARMTCTVLEPEEVDALRSMDRAFMQAYAREMADQQKRREAKQK
jgi:hypothetical protein